MRLLGLGCGLAATPMGLAAAPVDGGRAWLAIHSDKAPLVWRAPEGPGGLAAVPVGGGRAWPESHRRAWQHTARHASLVWRAPEGPEGKGGLRGAVPNEVRSPSLAGGRARRRPEHPWRHTATRRSQTCGNPAPQMRDGVSPTQSGGRV